MILKRACGNKFYKNISRKLRMCFDRSENDYHKAIHIFSAFQKLGRVQLSGNGMQTVVKE